ncbi:cytochrome D1 domain-containing protein [Caenispirillum salinarum]|uniref:cytochrome D1 domain-containing protein n=1 Tax=Caenispirillum salinarum TaxID=859058 RepID=UPI00384A72E3
MGVRLLVAASAAVLALAVAARAAEPDAARLYTENCAACHGGDRLGAIGPALLPQNLGRLKRDEAVDVILHSRPASQMPAFGDSLSRAEAEALAAYIFAAPEALPDWGMAETAASHIQHVDPAALPDAPVFDADPLNLFSVVESGDHHVSVLDGDTFERLARFESRFALHGGIKYSPDGRFAYMASRDGWVSMYDLYSLQMVAEVRAGINTRNIAVSGDGKWVAVGNTLPGTVVILNAADLTPHRVIPVVGDRGETSRVSAVYAAPPRDSFIVALKDLPEVWEIPYVKPKKPHYPGLVHNYEPGMVEALGVKDQAFQARRIKLDDYLDDFFFSQDYQNLMGAARNGHNGQVVNLIVGRKIADIPLSGMPHLGSGITFDWQGRRVMASPNLKEAKITVLDMQTWEVVTELETLGPGFFMRSHANSPHAFADVFFGPNRDAVHVIDKESLEIVETLRPRPGRTVAHAEFTDDGKYVLLSVMEDDGALLVYDAATLELVKEIPMRRPVGKYNVANKIRYEEGTSH